MLADLILSSLNIIYVKILKYNDDIAENLKLRGLIFYYTVLYNSTKAVFVCTVGKKWRAMLSYSSCTWSSMWSAQLLYTFSLYREKECATYFNRTFAYEIYYYRIYFYEIYFYGSILLLHTVYTNPQKIILETL